MVNTSTEERGSGDGAFVQAILIAIKIPPAIIAYFTITGLYNTKKIRVSRFVRCYYHTRTKR